MSWPAGGDYKPHRSVYGVQRGNVSVDGLSEGRRAARPAQIIKILNRIAVLTFVAFLAACASAPPGNDPEAVAEFKQINILL